MRILGFSLTSVKLSMLEDDFEGQMNIVQNAIGVMY